MINFNKKNLWYKKYNNKIKSKYKKLNNNIIKKLIIYNNKNKYINKKIIT